MTHRILLHEAAHAVIAHELGVPLNYIEIVTGEGGEILEGYTHFGYGDDDYEFCTRYENSIHCQIDLAGMVCDSLSDSGIYQACMKAGREMRDLDLDFPPDWVDDHYEADLEMLMWRLRSDDEWEASFTRLWGETLEKVMKKLPTIQRVSERLESPIRLWGREFLQLIESPQSQLLAA
jgi:hypothetical protein